jgi:hypothetical protein
MYNKQWELLLEELGPSNELDLAKISTKIKDLMKTNKYTDEAAAYSDILTKLELTDIDEITEEYLKVEISTAMGVGSTATPLKKSTKKTKYMEPGILYNTENITSLTESYKDFNALTPETKVRVAIKEANKSLKTVKTVMANAVRMKSENSLSGKVLNKPTRMRLAELTSNLVEVSKMMKELKKYE